LIRANNSRLAASTIRAEKSFSAAKGWPVTTASAETRSGPTNRCCQLFETGVPARMPCTLTRTKSTSIRRTNNSRSKTFHSASEIHDRMANQETRRRTYLETKYHGVRKDCSECAGEIHEQEAVIALVGGHHVTGGHSRRDSSVTEDEILAPVAPGGRCVP